MSSELRMREAWRRERRTIAPEGAALKRAARTPRWVRPRRGGEHRFHRTPATLVTPCIRFPPPNLLHDLPTSGDNAMTKHKIGTRKDWLAARLELLAAEKELTRRGDELARRRQELPWVRIDKKYRFETDEGGASLAELFRGRSQLLIYHFMFGPGL